MDLCSARTSAYLSLSRVGHAHRFQKMKAMRENMGNSLSPTGCNPSRIKNMVEIQAGKDRSTNPTFPLSREGTRASDSSETLLQLPSMQPGLAQSLCTTLVLLHGSQNQEKRDAGKGHASSGRSTRGTDSSPGPRSSWGDTRSQSAPRRDPPSALSRGPSEEGSLRTSPGRVAWKGKWNDSAAQLKARGGWGHPDE